MKAKHAVVALMMLGSGVTNATYSDLPTNLFLTGTGSCPIVERVQFAVQKLCGQAGGSLTIYNAVDSDHMAYVCTVPMAGTPITTVYYTSSGGAVSSIHGMSNDTAKQQQPVSLVSGCSAPAAATNIAGPYFSRSHCNLEPVAASDGGYSDIEYGPMVELFDAINVAQDGFSVAMGHVRVGPTALAEIYGMMVNLRMYNDLQQVQGLVAAGCALGDSTPACQPTIRLAEVRSLISNNEFSAFQNIGAEKLGLTPGTPIEFARRSTTCMRERATEIHFLGKGCLNGSNFGALDVAGNVVPMGGVQPYNGGAFLVSMNACGIASRLMTANATHYAFGFGWTWEIPTAAWRYVKLAGAHAFDGTATGMGKQSAIDGDYEFFFEAVSHTVPSVPNPPTDSMELQMVESISALMSNLEWPLGAGIFVVPDNPHGYTHAEYPTAVSDFQRGGGQPNSCQPVANPY